MSKYQKIILAVIVLAIGAGVVVWKIPMTKGLDIAGGMRVVLQADTKDPDWPKTDVQKQADTMQSIRDTISKRAAGIGGVTDPRVQVQGNSQLVVELPGTKNPEDALRQIKSTASLKFYHLKNVKTSNNPTAYWRMTAEDNDNEKGFVFTGNRGEVISSTAKNQKDDILNKVVDIKHNKPILTGKDLQPDAMADIDQQDGVVIRINFKEKGAEKFREFTRANKQEILAIFFDNRLLTAPEIRDIISTGRAQISGFKSIDEAKKTAMQLNAGALPIPLSVVAKDTVEPTLGQETITKAITAGIVGILLVILFMLFYYRLPGAIADVALCLYALFTFAVFKSIHASMSLAGLAAFILSVGMAVDANILIFERLKEELRSGKTLRAAIDAGFNRAFTAIFDSNMCTAITCAILMWYGSPAVQSFAFTLIIGVAISMFTAITVTRTILHLLVGWEWAQQPNLYGIGTSWIARKGITLDIIGKRAYAFIFSALIVLPGVYFLVAYGLKPGIEFKSGTVIQARFEQPVQYDAVVNAVKKNVKEVEVQLADGKKSAFVKTSLGSESPKTGQIETSLRENFKVRDIAMSSVGPTISKELAANAILAVIIASCGIILYLTFRFAIGGLATGFKYGVCAVVALIHDAFFIVGLFAILGKVAGWEVDSLFVTAVLTIIGFSVHDTIVVYDRIRENLRHRQRGESFEQLANKSILQTISRSVNTSLTVVLTLGALLAFGGPLLRHFYVALLAGIIVGTYSSIFVATPLIVIWDNLLTGHKSGKKETKKGFEDKPMLEKAAPAAFDMPATTSVDEAIDAEPKNGNGAGEKTDRIKKKTSKKRRF